MPQVSNYRRIDACRGAVSSCRDVGRAGGGGCSCLYDVSALIVCWEMQNIRYFNDNAEWRQEAREMMSKVAKVEKKNNSYNGKKKYIFFSK